MSESPVPYPLTSERSQRLSEVSRLASLLADRVLSAQIGSQPIPKAHIHALLDAAIILENHEVELPPLLEQMVQKLEDGEANMPEQAETEGGVESPLERDEAGAKRLAWLFRPFQGTKD